MDGYVEPDPSRAVLLPIDVQRDFTAPEGAATVPGTAEAVQAMERLVRAFREADRPIVHVVRLYRGDGSNVDACRRADVEDGAAIVRPGTAGAEIVRELTPDPAQDDDGEELQLDADHLLGGELQRLGDREWAMYKPRWSAFHRTPLDDHLADRDVDTVVVCGCNFPNCPRTTVYDASQRDYRLVLVPDATSGTYERGLDELASIEVALFDVDEAVDWLG